MQGIGMLIDYEWCSGCHSCEIACQMEHGFPVGQTGLSVQTIGPWEISKDHWQYTNIVVPTDQCNACTDRLEKGKLASCAHHCQAKCLQIGSLDDLISKLSKKPKQSLYCLI